MNPIDKIEAGAEQIYDDVSLTLARRYYDILDNISGYLKKKFLTLAIYFSALVLLLIGITGSSIYIVYLLAEHSPLTSSEAWGVVGISFIVIGATIGSIGYYRSQRLARRSDESEEKSSSLNERENSSLNDTPSISGNRKTGIDELKDGMSDLISPSYHIKRHPVGSLLIASLAGVSAGIMSKQNASKTLFNDAKSKFTARQTAHRKQSQTVAPASKDGMSFTQSAYALVAPLVVNAIRKKVADHITSYISNSVNQQKKSPPSKFTAGNSDMETSDESLASGRGVDDIFESEDRLKDLEIH